MYQLPPKEWEMPLADKQHNERNREMPHAAQLITTEKSNGFPMSQSRMNLPWQSKVVSDVSSINHSLDWKPSLFKIHFPSGRGHLLWRRIPDLLCPRRAGANLPYWDGRSAPRDRASRHVSALGSAHPLVGSQDQREYEKLIIVSGTDWAPDEEEFHTSPQAPPGQMVFLCAICVWPGSERSQVLTNICSPLHNCCNSSRNLARVGTGGVHAQPDMGHPTVELQCYRGSARQHGALHRVSWHHWCLQRTPGRQ